MRYLFNRLKERSTWIAISSVASALLGCKVLPDSADTILTLTVVSLGALGVTTKES